MQAAKWKIRTRGIHASASPSRRLEDVRRWMLRRSLESFWVTNIAGELRPRRRLLRYFQSAREMHTAVHGGRWQRNGTPKFLSHPAEVYACVKGTCGAVVTMSLPASDCKRKRAEVFQAVDEVGEVMMRRFSLWIAPVTIGSLTVIWSLRQFEQRIARVGIRRAPKFAGPLTRLAWQSYHRSEGVTKLISRLGWDIAVAERRRRGLNTSRGILSKTPYGSRKWDVCLPCIGSPGSGRGRTDSYVEELVELEDIREVERWSYTVSQVHGRTTDLIYM